jgi:hypothetical protein
MVQRRHDADTCAQHLMRALLQLLGLRSAMLREVRAGV